MATFKIKKTKQEKELLTDFEGYVRISYGYFRRNEGTKKKCKK